MIDKHRRLFGPVRMVASLISLSLLVNCSDDDPKGHRSNGTAELETHTTGAPVSSAFGTGHFEWACVCSWQRCHRRQRAVRTAL